MELPRKAPSPCSDCHQVAVAKDEDGHETGGAGIVAPALIDVGDAMPKIGVRGNSRICSAQRSIQRGSPHFFSSRSLESPSVISPPEQRKV